MNKTPLIIVLILAAGLGVGYYFGYDRGFEKAAPPITSFEECAAAGYPIMESYPEQCRTPDGRNFTRKISPPAGGWECTADAKICPDGSAVGRTGPKCEFAACPLPVATSTSKSGVRGTVLLGPQCPVVRDDEECPDKPFETTLDITSSDGSRVVATIKSDATGFFTAALAPGEYAIRSADTSRPYPTCGKVGVFPVNAGKYTEVEVRCDTGIR